MSELKSVYIDRTGDWVRSGNDTGQFYLKSETDRYIVHQKYKRCLANARICHMAWWDSKWDKKPNFFIIHNWRWWNIWLELAEHYKEVTK